MTQNPLDDHVGHAKPVQIAPEATTRRVPAMPLRQSCVTLVAVINPFVFLLLFACTTRSTPKSAESLALYRPTLNSEMNFCFSYRSRLPVTGRRFHFVIVFLRLILPLGVRTGVNLCTVHTGTREPQSRLVAGASIARRRRK